MKFAADNTDMDMSSSTVIEDITVTCPKSTVAYFYFDFRNEREHVDIMVRSIIWQLSRRSPSPYSALHRLYETLGNGTIQPQHAHLQGILKDLLSDLGQKYMIIDGLDECRKTDWKLLIEFIHSLHHPTKNALHLLFTSQLFEEFQKAFKDVTFIELGSAVSTGDIRSFVGSEVLRVGNWASSDEYAQDVTEQIVQKSNGMFRMAACLLLELHKCHWEDNWVKTLTTLPADLFGIYDHFLTWAKDTLPSVFIQAIFRWLLFSARQVTTDELADAIAFPLDNPAFDFSDPAKSIYHPNRHQGNSGIFKLLEGLIMIKKVNNAWSRLSFCDWDKLSIALTHSSVKDYLLSSQFHQKFGSFIDLTKGVSHKFITQTCVRYLLLFADATHSMTKETLPHYPMSLYAAEYWFYHLQLCDNWDQETLLPSTMHLLEDGSSQYAALYQLRPLPWYMIHVWDEPISPAICMCSEIGYTAGVQSLLTKHSTSVNQADKDGWTALHRALSKGRLDIAQLLIECSTFVDQANKDGWITLHYALSKDHLDIAQLLIECSTSINQADKHGWTTLHLASSKGHLNIVQLLMKHSASVNQADKDGWTALHLASSGGHLNIAQLLIECSASVNQADKDGWTALHLASREGHLDIVQLLIECSASIKQAEKHGWTALHHASSGGHLNIVQLLIEHSASVNQVDKHGRTALHRASSRGHLDIAQLLTEHSASVNQADKHGWTALHLASREGHLDIVQLLIKHNASVVQADRDGRTALHLASRKGHLNIAQLLIEHSTSVDQADRYGRTVQHLALKEGHLDTVQLLIKCNASVVQADRDGGTVLN
ncbi:HET-domain-containing protein [Mycena venus]|uniref:HET-domain-containing protein n=1 Tax=Mycena venus TaxID=2733690 RepID=A0A8H7D3Y7_9AGAR|nr:HET-domain-containing protein [Mycena venus]